jgi:hypothetical protein
MPFCESRISGLRALSDAASAIDAVKTAVAETAAAARMNLSEQTEGIGGPVGFENAGGCAANALPYRGVTRQASRYSPRIGFERRLTQNFCSPDVTKPRLYGAQHFTAMAARQAPPVKLDADETYSE